MNSNKKKYYYWIDFLRWIAAIGIVFTHYHTLIFGTWKNIFDKSIQPLYNIFSYVYELGTYGVWFFWIISGFVFTNLYFNINSSKKDFFISRFARLYPLHLLTLILVLILQSYSYFAFQGYQIYFTNDFYHFLLNFFLITKWGFEKGASFNYPIWSVSVELIILIFFIYTLDFLKKFKIIFTIMMVIIAKTLLLTISFSKGIVDNSTLYDIYTCLFYFFSGSFLYFFKIYFNKFKNKKFFIYLLLFVFSIILLNLEQYYNEPLGSIIPEKKGFFTTFEKIIPTTVLIFSSIILLATSLEDIFPSIGKKIKILGDSSYCIYLIHIPINISLLIITKKFNFDNAIFLNDFFLIFYLFFIQFLSICIFKFFESVMRKKIKNYFKIYR